MMNNFNELSASDLADVIRSKQYSCFEVMNYFLNAAAEVTLLTNCCTKLLREDALFRAKELDKRIESGEQFSKEDYPILGVPISVKDSLDIENHATVCGYKRFLKNIAKKDSGIVLLIRKLGGIPFCKSNLCQLAMTLEGSNPVYGQTLNAINPSYTPGGSSSGEGPLIKLKGSVLGFGSDIGGSIRYPAAFNGIYGFKPTSNRLPCSGHTVVQQGQDFIPISVGPLSNNIDDIQLFFKAAIDQRCWELDPNALPIPYQQPNFYGKKLKVGYYLNNGYLPLSPANLRGMSITLDALRKDGHELIEFDMTDFSDLSILALKILGANAHSFTKKLLLDEGFDPTFKDMIPLTYTPHFFRTLLRYLLHDVFDQKGLAYGLDCLIELSVDELWKLQQQCKDIHIKFMDQFNSLNLDFMICPITPIPAFKHEKFSKFGMGFNYAFMYNVLDMPAGVLPVTKVNPQLDQMPSHWIQDHFKTNPKLGSIAFNSLYSMYDASDMKDLPIAVQIVAPRYQDEKVIEAMKIVDSAIKDFKKSI